MATTFDVNRIGGGTFELVQDPSTGQYSYKKVGFNPVKSLTIPDLGTATTAAATTTETKKDTTDISKPFEQLAKQTSGRDDTIDYTGQMLKDARKIDPQLQMTRDNLTSSFIGEERPTKTYAEQLADLQKPPMLGDTGGSMDQMSGAMTNQYRSESEKFKTRFDPTQIQPATPKVNPKSITVDSDNNLYKGGVLIGKGNPKSLRVGADGKVYRDGVYIGDGNPKSIRAVTGAEITGASGTDKAAMTSDAAQLGISKVESTQPTIGSFGTDPTSLVGGKDLEEDPGAQPRPDIEVEPTALKKVSTGLKSLADSVGRVVSSGPVGQIAKAIGKPVGESAGAVAFNKTYFNVRGGSTDGQRIAGNPATDLYAGMNRTSKFGNLEKAGDKRIATREKTIARKNYGPGDKFYDDTQKMKDQAKDYKSAKKSAPVTGTTKPGTSGGSGGGGGGSSRVICTDLYKTGELSTKDWIRDTKFTFKKLSIKHVKGYLLWAEPTVRHIQKYPTYRKIWKHIAQHRANDIAWRLNEGKFDLLGRIYAGIGEPLCWMLGNFVSDKQINRYNLSHWRRV
jgi:hypothetical protein